MSALAPPTQPGERLSDLLARRAVAMTGERISLGDIVELLGDRSIGALLLVLALPMALPVPTPGLSITFGLPMVLVAAQLACGRRRAWLPAVLARRSLGREAFRRLIDYLLPALRRLERVIRPRAGRLAGDWMMVPVGLICVVLALVIVLPIPLGHVVPGIAVSVLALGLVERDGVTVSLGLCVAAAGLALVTAASAGVLDVLMHW